MAEHKASSVLKLFFGPESGHDGFAQSCGHYQKSFPVLFEMGGQPLERPILVLIKFSYHLNPRMLDVRILTQIEKNAAKKPTLDIIMKLCFCQQLFFVIFWCILYALI